jgi:hypothetical protein
MSLEVSMMRQSLRSVAVLFALVAGAGTAHAGSFAVVPGAGGELPAAGPLVLVAPRAHPLLADLEARGPVLRARGDTVELRVVARARHGCGRVRVVLMPARPLVDGAVYQLALTRNASGFGLNRAEIPLPGLAWVARADAPPSLAGRLILFGALPFLAGYAAVAGLIVATRRRRLAALLGPSV